MEHVVPMRDGKDQPYVFLGQEFVSSIANRVT